jgi:hypothetical protein
MLFRTGFLVFRGRGVVNPNHDITMHAILPTLSNRQKTAGQNHHLWNNHGSWWFHGTEHRPDGTARRTRSNLKTRDVSEARRKRDRILSLYAHPQHTNP